LLVESLWRAALELKITKRDWLVVLYINVFDD